MHGQAEDRYPRSVNPISSAWQNHLSVIRILTTLDRMTWTHLEHFRPYHDPGLSGRQQEDRNVESE
jgi:hypothetical protein